MYDALVIGAGVVGCSVARELSRYQIQLCVLEKEEDVCCGTSKANSGIVHAGFDAVPGSLKAVFNVKGSRMMESLSKELDFSFRRNGSLVLCFDEADIPKLEELKEKGELNGVPGLEIIRGSRIKEISANISENTAAILYAPAGGIVCPFELTLAMAENAFVNGAEFFFRQEVMEIIDYRGYFEVRTRKKVYETKTVINAAGVYGDLIHNMVSQKKILIIPRKGEYCLLDKKAGDFTDKTLFQLPSELGKGVLITPTVHGNLLLGPTAEDIEDKEGTDTTAEGIEMLLEKARLSAKSVPAHMVITSFAGLRAHAEGDDFIIGEAEDTKGFYDAVGIESPGLTSAPAIGCAVAEAVAEKLSAIPKENFTAKRKGIARAAGSDSETIRMLIDKNPAYGSVVCRCEQITEGEIMDAIHRPLGAKSLDGIKRRTRAGMGRCQGGFCMPKTLEILERELGISPFEVTKSGADSHLLAGYNKEDL